jgi:catechol 2,3-dioxygenase-like lactoylglutathione lyase family enzyme
MKFGYVIIYVADVKDTISFYEKAFNLKPSFVHESGEYGELDTGTAKLAFASEAMAAANCGEFKKNVAGDLPPGFEVAFVTNDVKNAYQNASISV